MNLQTLTAYRRYALYRNFRMCSDGISMMMIRSSALLCIAKKLQDHAFLDLEFHPPVESDMCADRHQYDKCDNNL